MERKIVEVNYTRKIEQEGKESCLVEYMDNIVRFEDGSETIRYGITRVHGKNIKEMTESLKEATKKHGWWSLQTTNIQELKAAFRAGFRNKNLSGLKQHINEFQKGSTLYVEKVV